MGAVAQDEITLDQIGGFIATYGVKAEVHHASESSTEEFCALAGEHLSSPNRHVIVITFAGGQEKGGHISPLAAYDADTDRFLVLDVARYKYPSVWISAAELLVIERSGQSSRPFSFTCETKRKKSEALTIAMSVAKLPELRGR